MAKHPMEAELYPLVPSRQSNSSGERIILLGRLIAAFQW